MTALTVGLERHSLLPSRTLNMLAKGSGMMLAGHIPMMTYLMAPPPGGTCNVSVMGLYLHVSNIWPSVTTFDLWRHSAHEEGGS